MPIETIAALLDRADLPGTSEELDILSTRIEELIRRNGRQWVIRHRLQLLKEWTFIVEQAVIRQP